jgi:hypothetical protein
MSWDEIREKSHDYAWKSVAINSPIAFEDIIREAGMDDEYVEYVREQSMPVNLCR